MPLNRNGNCLGWPVYNAHGLDVTSTLGDSGGQSSRAMRILVVNSRRTGGGAESIAGRLWDGYRRAGHGAVLAVGGVAPAEYGVVALSPYIGLPAPRAAFGRLALWSRQRIGTLPGAGRLAQHLDRLARPGAWLDWWWGREDYRYPATAQLLDLPPAPPDLVHAHNLHGGYFDLTRLPALAARCPWVLTLHDAWLLSGHCAHSLDCNRWVSGCGRCPDLTLYPAVRRDVTAANWATKRDIFARTRLYLATPSRWLMDKVERSLLRPAIVEARIIPNGVPTQVFAPATDRTAVRRALGLPNDALVLLAVANHLTTNRWKDFATLEAALRVASARLEGRPAIFLGVGDDAPSRRIGAVEARFVPHVKETPRMVAYYQSADIYLHPARAENFPTTVLEAMACGLPVVASAVGGIPEQVVDGHTGLLTSPGDAPALAEAMVGLAEAPERRAAMSSAARRRAIESFRFEGQVTAYLDWFESIVGARRTADDQGGRSC
jgi:glycosyltransferase involved in cell wall biosynthesis